MLSYVIVQFMDNRNRESLIVQLQTEVVNSGVPISDILRKAKILASLLKNEEFKGWIDAELGGYSTPDGRPEYRRFRSMSFGTFAGRFGQMAKNVPIPGALLPTSLQELAGHLEMSQGVKEIETLAAQAGQDGAVRIAWPAEAVILARDHVQMDDGSMLVEAWKPLVKGQLDGILDQVRNRLLDFFLELREINPEIVNSETAIRDVPRDTVTHLFQTTIYGGRNIVATGTNFEQKTTEQIGIDDKTSLLDYLDNTGIDSDSLSELENAIREDGDRRQERELGRHVKSWIGKMMVKALDGTWKTALKTAPGVLQGALSRYYGWD